MAKQRPVFSRRVGHIGVAIWENPIDDKNGSGTGSKPPRAWHNVAITRSYRDDKGEWKEATTFNGLGDLAQVAVAVGIAQEWIRKRQEDEEATEY